MTTEKFEGPNSEEEESDGFEVHIHPGNADRLLAGEWEWRAVGDIAPGDIIVQFGNKHKVLEVAPQKKKFNIAIERKGGEKITWEGLHDSDKFRILKPKT